MGRSQAYNPRSTNIISIEEAVKRLFILLLLGFPIFCFPKDRSLYILLQSTIIVQLLSETRQVLNKTENVQVLVLLISDGYYQFPIEFY